MKKIILLLILMLLCGCSTDYNLEISNNSFKENISAIIDKDLIPKKTVDDVEVDDQITPFIENDYSALITKESFYKKTVNYLDNYINVNMEYEYTEDTFGNSSTINLCFENHEFIYGDNYYINLSGEFYCLYSDNLTINIKTNNKVIKNNADQVNGNIYTWNINNNNVDNVNIEFEVEKGISISLIILLVSVTILVSFILILICLLYKKNKENNQI